MIKIKWIDGMKFYAYGPSNHLIVMDSSPDVGGDDTASRPMEVFLFSLGGCTGMDAISILRKMKQKVTDFWIDIESERASEHPKVYTKVRLAYYFKGKGLNSKMVEKAVKLSQDKYCSISEMIRKTAKLEYEIKILE